MYRPNAKTAVGIDQPNLVIPFATSYNTRGIDGDDNIFTDALDQRRVNCIYVPVQNSQTNKATLYLAKRPGVDDLGSTYGADTQTTYLVEVAPGATSLTAANHWVFSTSGNDVRASDTSTTTVIFTSANYIPVYVDKTLVAGSDTLVLQTRNTSTNVQRVWYSTAIGTWAEITDADFTGLTIKGKMEFMDGYAFALSSTNRIYSSDLNSLSAWSTTSYISKQMMQDIPSGLAKFGKYILAFGQNTMEVFHDVGNATGSPLELLPEKAIVGVGLAPVEGSSMRHYYTVHSGLLFFLGNSPKGLYAYDGQKFTKVSTPAIDAVINSLSVYSVSKLVFGGKTAIALSLNSAGGATQRMLLFFPEWNDWFEWNSTTWAPVTSSRIGHTCIGTGSANQHKLFKLEMEDDNWQDAGTNYTETVQFTLPKDGNHIHRMRMCGVSGDTARAASSLSVYFSDDDGQNWTSARTIDMTSATKMLRNCGSYRNRQVRLTHSGNEENRLEQFFAKID